MQLLRPAGHPPGAEVQLLLRLQPDRVLSPVRGPGELWLADSHWSRYSSLIGPGLPLRQAAEGLLPDQGGRVAAAVLLLGGRAARRRRHGPGLWAELGEDHGKLLVWAGTRSGSLVIVRHYLAIRSIEYSSHVVSICLFRCSKFHDCLSRRTKHVYHIATQPDFALVINFIEGDGSLARFGRKSHYF